MSKYSRMEVMYAPGRLDVPVEPVLLSWQGPAGRVKIYRAGELCYDSQCAVDSPFVPDWQPEMTTFYRWTLDDEAEDTFRTAYANDFNWAPAEWMISAFERNDTLEIPVTRFRKEFELMDLNADEYTISIGVLGCYQLYVNGSVVSDAVLAPGSLDFYNRTLYQVYRIKHLLKKGSNIVEVDLSGGWHSGTIFRQGPYFTYPIYKSDLSVILRLEAESAEEHKLLLASGCDWECSCQGPWRYSDIYMGEFFDATKTFTGFAPVRTTPQNVRMDCRNGLPVKRIMELPPCSIVRLNNVSIVDFGQNFAGRERIKFNAPRGTQVRIRHGEMLNADGSLYTENLRDAKSETVIIASGGDFTFEPEFTFYGFRYVEVSGVDEFEIVGVVLHSNMQLSGSIQCDNPLVNQLFSNIIWGQRSNFLDIPTDCPQRDEKRGWTGDIQVFCRAALFNMHSMALLRKWFADLRSNSLPDGRICNYAPLALKPWRDCDFGTSGWADAIVVCPWNLYLVYGDKSILQENAESIYRWLDYQAEHSENGLCRHARFADWLNMDAPTSEEFISTAYFAYGASLAGRIADILGNTLAADRMKIYYQMAHAAFQRHFVGTDNLLTEHSQCALAMALQFGLLNDEQKKSAAQMLENSVRALDNHLNTGFLGTPLLLHALSDNGKLDTAYALLEQTTLPSWLYPVTQGATTIWERWNSYSLQDGFGDVRMNSFNHYAYGAVADWLYMNCGGIRPLAEKPGFREFILAPQPGGSFRNMEISFDSPAGMIRSAWQLLQDKTIYEFTVPEGTTAYCRIGLESEKILKGGQYRFEI